MEYEPLTPGRAALLAVAFYVWFLYRLWLGRVVRPEPTWSPRLDGVALGTAAYAAFVVVAGVVRP